MFHILDSVNPFYFRVGGEWRGDVCVRGGDSRKQVKQVGPEEQPKYNNVYLTTYIYINII